jgi:1-phosphatidylinositol phosphodiesterase
MAANPARWMAQLQNKRIYDLFIPGTHDSGTEGYPVGSPSRTQYYKIDEQLAGGVRFLDMRLAYNSVEDNFHVVHAGDVISYLNFDTVVEWCDRFLTQNPSETILMSIKQEGSFPGSEDAFAHGLSIWHARHSSQGDWRTDLWYTATDHVPTVAEAKSKIILLRRYTVAPPPSGGAPLLFFGGFNLDFINSSQSGTF